MKGARASLALGGILVGLLATGVAAQTGVQKNAEADRHAIAMPFSPPIGSPLIYSVTQSQPGPDGDTLEFNRDYRLKFEHSGRAYRLSVELRDVTAAGPDRIASGYRAALQPLVGNIIAYRVSEDCQTIYLEDPASVRHSFNAVLSSIDESSRNGGDRLIAQAAIARYAKLDDAQLSQVLFNDIRPLFQFSGSAIDSHTMRFDHGGRDGMGGSRSASTNLTITQKTGFIEVGERTVTTLEGDRSDGMDQLVTTINYVVDRSTGLATRIVEHQTIDGDPSETLTLKTRSLVLPTLDGN